MNRLFYPQKSLALKQEMTGRFPGSPTLGPNRQIGLIPRLLIRVRGSFIVLLLLNLPIATYTQEQQEPSAKSQTQDLAKSTQSVTQEVADEKSAMTKNDKADTKELIYFNFTDTPLVDIINDLAAKKNINIILPQGNIIISAKVNYHLPDPLTIDQAWEKLNDIIALAGFAWGEKTKSAWQLKPIEQNKLILREPLALYFNEPLKNIPNNQDYVRALFYLSHIIISDANIPINAILRDMLSPVSSIFYDPKSNAVIITDRSLYIQSAMSIILELDRGGIRQAIEVLPLHYTAPQLIADLFAKDILKIAEAPTTPGAPPPSRANYFPSNTRVIPIDRLNAVVIMGTTKGIDVVRNFIVKYLDHPLESGKSIVHLYDLQYLNAKDAAEVLTQLISNQTVTGQATTQATAPKHFKDVIIDYERRAPTVAIQPTAGTAQTTAPVPAAPTTGVQTGGNHLIVAARSKDWEQIKKLIQDLDKPQPQVAIDALVVDLTLNNRKVLGTQLRNKASATASIDNNINFQSSQLTNPILTQIIDPITGNTVFPPNALAANLLQLAQGTNFAANVTNPNNPVNDFGALIVSFNDPASGTSRSGIWAILEVLERYASTTILSQPFVVTRNNEKATVSVSEMRLLRQNVTAEGGGLAVNFSYVPASVIVDIVPRISLTNNVNLQITVNITEYVSQVADNRITRNVVTNANVGNGEILVLGGLIKNTDVIDESEVPLLGRIPIIGWFFKRETKTQEKDNLLIFISPKIIEPRKQGGMDTYTVQKTGIAKNDLAEHTNFENLRDPITRWFFQPDIGYASRVIGELKSQQIFDENINIANAPSLPEKTDALNHDTKNIVVTDANESLKKLVEHEDNPLVKQGSNKLVLNTQ